MAWLIVGLVLFLGGHSVSIVSPSSRNALAGCISVKRRAAAGLLRSAPTRPGRSSNDAIALVGGLALYVATAFWLHGWLFGVRPFG